MSKLTIAGLTALFIAGVSPAYAQAPATQPSATTGVGIGTPSEDDLKAFTERRIEVVKFALQLRPDQEKYWPAVEGAIRARGDMRRKRLAQLASLANDQQDRNIVDLMRMRADSLTERGASLKKLADAWQPLYATLDDRQKLRLRFLAAVVLREIRDAADNRMMEIDDESEDYR
jgi:LTXXQ motif family protein